jgi:hypothetical protein
MARGPVLKRSETRRRLKHLAVSVLSWFLISPPFVGPATNRQMDTNAPISRWQILQPYGSRAECLYKSGVFAEAVVAQLKGASQNEVAKTFMCVSSDDSRFTSYLGRALTDQSWQTPSPVYSGRLDYRPRSQ